MQYDAHVHDWEWHRIHAAVSDCDARPITTVYPSGDATPTADRWNLPRRLGNR